MKLFKIATILAYMASALAADECLTISSIPGPAGTKLCGSIYPCFTIMVAPCDGTPGQYFEYNAWGNLVPKQRGCLDVFNCTGPAVETCYCNGYGSQIFSFNADTTLTNTLQRAHCGLQPINPRTLCLGINNNTKIVAMTACDHNDPTQQGWSYDANKHAVVRKR